MATTGVEAWLRGDRASGMAEFGLEAAPVVANCALEMIRGGVCPPLDVLRRLANHPDGMRLLMAVTRRQWEEVRDLLPVGPSIKPLARNDSAQALRSPNALVPRAAVNYVAVSLAPNGVWVTDRSELDFLVQAARYDAGLLRHLLTWAAAQPEENAEGWIVDETLPMPKQMDTWIAQAVWWVLTHPRPRWNADLWDDDGASYVSCAVFGAVDHTALIRGARAYEIYPYSLLYALAETVMDITPTARAIAAHSYVLDAMPGPEFGPHASGWDKKVLSLLPLDTEERYLTRIGWSVGLAIHAKQRPATVTTVASLLGKEVEEVADHLVCGLALLWAGVLELAAIQGGGRVADQARSAVLARLARHRQEWSRAWEASVRELVVQGDKISPEIFDLVTEAAIDNEPIRQILRDLDADHPDRATRNRAGAILARVDGLSDTSAGARQLLGDQAARVYDGTPMFPQPLTTLSRTWLGSLELEATLAGCVRRAADRFREYVRDQGAWQEEGLLGRLTAHLEDAFIDANLTLAFGKRQDLTGTVSVGQRSVVKNQETEWGCDLALLLNIDIASAARLRLAELVQVKKSEALKHTGRGEPREAWRIEIPQLRALLGQSQSAGYWLIRASGEVLCVTARWLWALAAGTGVLKQGSFTAGYNEVRHQAVPLEQYVTELMIGTWLGTSEEEVLNFVAEGDPRMVPRHIFEITVAREGRRDR